MAVGCSHGEFAHPKIAKQVLQFRKDFAPHIRFELGDITDTTAFRTGARGTKDEQADPEADLRAGLRWLQRYEPTHIAWGNHDWRLYKLLDCSNGIIAAAASRSWYELQDAAAKLKAQTRPYRLKKGWFDLFGAAWGHGYMWNEQALRDHAEYNGLPTIMAHIHAPQELQGRTRKHTPSFCVGAIADGDLLTYNENNRAKARHGHGIVFGEVCDTEHRLWLAKSENGETLHFPPGMRP